jgi:hypothetical protein
MKPALKDDGERNIMCGKGLGRRLAPLGQLQVKHMPTVAFTYPLSIPCLDPVSIRSSLESTEFQFELTGHRTTNCSPAELLEDFTKV